mmetsp:Transcript_14135/g.20060  ORF Transcript_14135/g.20060 Transcript_14135/m.20060 type:complete len:211 (+) Transcript_14135:472-1104(+)
MARLAMMVHRPSNVTEAGFGDPQRHVGGSPIVVPELAFRDALASCRLSNGSLRVYLGLLGTTAVTHHLTSVMMPDGKRFHRHRHDVLCLTSPPSHNHYVLLPAPINNQNRPSSSLPSSKRLTLMKRLNGTPRQRPTSSVTSPLWKTTSHLATMNQIPTPTMVLRRRKRRRRRRTPTHQSVIRVPSFCTRMPLVPILRLHNPIWHLERLPR